MTVLGFTVLTQLSLLMAVLAADPKSAVVVRVNGKPITVADVDFAATQQSIPAEERLAAEPKLIEFLIDRQLIRAFLVAKKIEPPAAELQHQIHSAEQLIRKNGEDPEKLLAKIGYTPARLKSEVGLPLAWQIYARRTITQEQQKEYFEQHKLELDGTQLRGRQIFFELDKIEGSDGETAENQEKKRLAQIAEKREKLLEVRRDILAGKLSFAEAAKQSSEAPSAKNGGDVGLFGWRGKLPKEVSQAAFGLRGDEISEPIVSFFGVHLIQVTERHPGDYSLEDVRQVILDRLSQQLWTATIAKERETAKIVMEKKKS